jgi:hypothetical protein
MDSFLSVDMTRLALHLAHILHAHSRLSAWAGTGATGLWRALNPVCADREKYYASLTRKLSTTLVAPQAWYDAVMTTVEIVFRYQGQPSETESFALANAREVYGIRRVSFDRAASTLLVEYDATRLNAATVTQLVRRSGLQLIEEQPPEPLPELAAAAPVIAPTVIPVTTTAKA